MTYTARFRYPRRVCASAFAALSCLIAALFAPALAAQPATGSITGTVSNGKTQQYLNEAEVKLVGTNQSVLTDRDGTYTLHDVTPGTHQLEVSYTGLDTEKHTVEVAAGKATREDFALTSGIYKLDKFVVASEYEGNAAELNKQKRADFFMTAISTDTLGEVPEGNIGEFLKYVPGLQVNYSNADAATVSMRGQDPDATTFTIDGQIPAAAGTPPRSSTGSSDASQTAFEFTQATITNLESIEVYKAPPPWLAPTTGGVINAESRSAFTQKRRVFRTTLLMSANSEMLKWQIPGPGERTTERIKPGGNLVYSEAFRQNTLGVSFSYGESHTINPTHNNAMGYTALATGTTTAPLTDAVPVRVDTFTLVDGPQAKDRRNASLKFDYKLTAHTSAFIGFTYNFYLSQNRGHTFRIRPITSGSSQSVILAGASDTDTTVQKGQVDVFADYSDYTSQNYTYIAGVRHDWGRWRLDYNGAFGKSDSRVTDLPAMIQSAQWNLIPSKGVTYRIQASPTVPAPIALTQLAGPDLYDLNSYDQTSFSLQTSPRFQNDRTLNLKADLRGGFGEWRFPMEFRAGTGLYRIQRRKMAGQIVLSFAGPDGIVGNADDVINAAQFADTTYGDKFLYGIRTPPLIDPYKVAAYMQQYPLAFQDLQPTNVQRQAVNSQSITEDIPSAYVADTIKVSNRLTLLAGIRYERTENYARGALRQTSLGVGLPTNSKAWYQAVYSQSQKYVSKYEDYFPNYQLTYRITPDVILRAAVTRSVARPKLQNILPNTSINDVGATGTISVTNTGLQPTYSNNIDVGLDIYTKPSGNLTLGWYRKNISNYIINETVQVQPGDDTGFGDQYPGYQLTTQANGGEGHFQGVEASARQQLQPWLKAIPEVLRGWEVFGNYSKSYKAEAPDRTGKMILPTAPNYYKWNANYGISFMSPRRVYRAEVRTVIYPSAVTTYANGTTDLRNTYEARHQRWDVTLRWTPSRIYSFEFDGSNIFKDPSRKFIQSGRVTQQRDFGANYILSCTINLDALMTR